MMSLRRYRARRDFARTPEPAGRASRTGSRATFVIQKHDASHLHYDFRLELDGVLKSWAVPKGPSLDPRDKRLAIMVEDHPVEYGSFEGTIPKGQYGGGTVLLWDRGTWWPRGDAREDLAKGHLSFGLRGEKLSGGWSLIRIGREGESAKSNWLLIKDEDSDARPRDEYDVTAIETASVATGRELEQISLDADAEWNGSSSKQRGAHSSAAPKVAKGGARSGARYGTLGRTRRGTKYPRRGAQLGDAPKASLPRSIAPTLARLVDSAPEGDRWLHELKLDGYRILARKDGRKVSLISRNDKDWTHRFPTVAGAVAALDARDAIIDGEIVALDAEGRSSFQALQRFLQEKSEQQLMYFAFDLLHLDGHDLRTLPLLSRKELLRELLATAPALSHVVRYNDHHVGRGAAVLAEACRRKLEGVVSKLADSPYRAGRNGEWVKIKCINRQEFIIGGYTDPQGSRVGIGALLLGVQKEGGKLDYVGRVGTGFNERTLLALAARLGKLERRESPFTGELRGVARRGAIHWVKPELVAEIAFSEWTQDGHLRHPAFEGLREDKSARQVVREIPQAVSDMEMTRVTLTNPERLLYPEAGITKKKLWAYYESVAERMLPHVAGRPLTLFRCPSGWQGSCFIQRHVKSEPPEGVRSVAFRGDDAGEEYILIDDLDGLLSLVQLGALEIHVWGAHERDIERPDRLIFDMDPDESLPFTRVIDAAKRARDILESVGLVSFVKTTGGKGLHVVVPVAPQLDWDAAKTFCNAVARFMSEESPDLITSVASKEKRKGKVYVDYLRNARGASAVAPYSTRARENAPVAMPVEWEQLNARFRPSRYTVKTAARELRRRAADPWEGFADLRQQVDLSRVE